VVECREGEKIDAHYVVAMAETWVDVGEWGAGYAHKKGENDGCGAKGL
jgi:mannose-1-phosphate guanylyltransferase